MSVAGTIVFVRAGRNAGLGGEVIQTFGKQSVVIKGLGTVYRRSLTTQSRRDLACAENGVTWAWLTTGEHNLSPAEAEAWLGMDS